MLLHVRFNLGFNPNYFSFFIANFEHLELFLFTFHIFDFFYPRINIPNIYNNIIDISSFQTGLNVIFNSTGFYFKSKVIEGSHKGKNMFFNF